MKKKPIFYDENQPLAHYEQARALKRRADRTLLLGKILPAAALVIGTLCIVYEPWYMALLALFGIPFTILSIVGSWIRRAGFSLVSMPLAVICALICAMSGSTFALVGTVVYAIAALLQLKVVSSLNDFYMLKELPGFPFFEHGMENLSFAALDIRNAEEFIDSSELYTDNSEVKKYVPIEPPSQEMQEISTEGIADFGAADKMGLLEFEPEDLADENMLTAAQPPVCLKKEELQPDTENTISDFELFG